MPPTWFLKDEGKVFGPFTPIQMKHMVTEGRIKEDTPVAREKSGPFVQASKYKGLIDPKPILAVAVARNAEPTDTPHDAFEELTEVNAPLSSLRVSRKADSENSHPMLALWSMAISSGLILASLLYAIAWKFSSPVWAYGTALVPVSIMLLIVSGYAYRTSKTRLNYYSFGVNIAFTFLTIVASAGSIYNMWSVESRMKESLGKIK